ncbi:hypothetical protein ADIARSV_2438 [Arcticibacter svalbardensis MN12-7]|uniref:Uncharacterized protein n=1 Tax=Arcticibacter svalbardensis MN12-7 TaxID=1150600 RepID=R9GZM9_9SPHI|nr:hypothetical protein ADIARSV_2438 [Arcticibacter svalbardensis MN12-7]
MNGKKSDDKIITLTDEKSRMEIEIDRIEAELDRTKNSYLDLSAELKEGQQVARVKITELRTQLKQGKLTQQQLARAQKEIKDLRSFVSSYTANIKELENKNVSLEIQRDSLQTTVANINERTSILEKENLDLNAKVKVGAALKIANIVVSAVRIRNSGKESEVTRASTAERIKIRFTIADNALAAKTSHDIFMRIVDPNGNLLIADGGSLFTANDDEMQYTYKTSIDFDNTYGKLFSIDWNKKLPFQKGEYTIILYADGYTVGKAVLALR